ncbi:MAG TPA: protein kinase, partial [Byssovorax sp.]
MTLELKPGSVFASDYRVVQRLGEGGMGSVYIVEQVSTGARRALKLMLPHLAANEEARARFEREAKVGYLIASDHVVQVIAAGVEAASGAPWIAMELLEGDPLATLCRDAPLPLDRARDVFEQLGHALAAAHAVDVVHRDLKPDNLHVGPGRRAGERLLLKVLDFGIA